MAGVIHSTLNPHGVSIIGGHGKEHADYYYDQDFDIDMMRQSSPRVPNTPHTPHSTGHGSTVGASHESTLPFITRNGYAAIMNIFWEKLDHPWPVFSKIPLELRRQIFERFRTLYRWSPTEEERIYQGFENILKERYRDRMRDARDASVILAEQGGHHIEDVNESFHNLENFHPQYIPENVWKNLCAYWNTPKWKSISACAKENRNTPDANGKTGRHTGGSIGNADHRRKLKEATG
ncbi:unnamed protein product [Lactuca saligna]|uniref:Uncharacterized protein n=1 Tax=Lactuca saligna TaxID=75948 RepID=A0AA35ZES2_LACSI|nr:unnamed protein product [Lactuca saligna]